jgi:hypothetical protein
MKKLFFILILALMTVTAGAQHRHGDRDSHDRGRGRNHIECATHDQMSMVMHTLGQQSFDDKKLEIAKLCVVLGHFCVDDLARMASVFSFDDSRLSFLTFAYQYCEDPQNYYDLRDSFSFRSNFDTMMDTVRPGHRH